MAWTTFGLKATTPLFNHDDTETGLRVASVKGPMRYWFRALAGTRFGDDVKGLARLEQEVFGSTERKCPVRLRLSGQPRDTFRGAAGALPLSDDDGKWIAYLLGQGHVAYNRETKKFSNTRPFVKPGGTFTLKVGFSGDERADALTMASLWLACTYGGFGARTRKGFGGVRLTHQEGPLPEIWQRHSADTPGIDHYRALGHLPVSGAVAECADTFLPKPNGRTGGTPSYPVLGEGATIAALGDPSGGTWREAAAEAGEMYRRFRAPRPNRSPNADYDPCIKTPEYEDVVYGDETRFPLGALGLPIVFKKGIAANANDGGEDLRRASPLWFRFVEDPEHREWRLFSFAFHSAFLPGGRGPEVRLLGGKQRRKTVTVTDADVRERTQAWMDASASRD
ncbi:type III-B CRISPR module RAMP protein Cmr1 [Nocardiopsis sp. RSe5-2]|uniref:Type III-B CRISPR module RAMP protein Cmr1 n=1 Tax=Nocardiopsis endophytica TaxID=3018445 RepID=A0ABT4U6I2_9ACTN|nr:type III-B CRISPR module RAMP protein Cmr1 [Nocardiopsis endophytica]MDA2812553.1 type III-B CRISPR module RAMP protein Cmr1 [Nocardiopsis endophytica]